MAYTLLSTQVPSPIVPASFTKLSDAYNTTAANGCKVADKKAASDTYTSASWNKNFFMMELLGRYACGVYCVAYGLGFSTSASLTLTVNAGQAVIDGIVELASNTTIVLPDVSTLYIYLKQDGTLTYVNGSLTPPAATVCVYLGRAVTSAGTVSAVDFSGVMYANGSLAVRYTADTGFPADTPSSATSFMTVTGGGSFLWSGGVYTQTFTSAQLAEAVQDIVGAFIQNGTGIAWTYSDAGNTLTPAVNRATASATQQVADGVNVETITGTKTLTITDCNVQALTASGASRDVQMPTTTSMNAGMWFRIINAGSSNNIVVKTNGGGTTLATLTPGMSVLCKAKYTSGGALSWPTAAVTPEA